LLGISVGKKQVDLSVGAALSNSPRRLPGMFFKVLFVVIKPPGADLYFPKRLDLEGDRQKA